MSSLSFGMLEEPETENCAQQNMLIYHESLLSHIFLTPCSHNRLCKRGVSERQVKKRITNAKQSLLELIQDGYLIVWVASIEDRRRLWNTHSHSHGVAAIAVNVLRRVHPRSWSNHTGWHRPWMKTIKKQYLLLS